MNSNKGITLIEVVIVMAIIMVFLGSVCGVVANFLFSSTTGENFLTASQKHERAMTVIREELIQTSADMVVPKFYILDENGDPITFVLGSEIPGVKIRFKKFSAFQLVLLGSTRVGKTVYSSNIEFYRDPATDLVLRRQWEGDELTGNWGEPQTIGSFCKSLTFTELPVRRVKITMTNEVGDPQRSYVAVYTNSVEVTPED
jgi:hypothetical protein